MEVAESRKSEAIWGTEHQFEHAGIDLRVPLQVMLIRQKLQPFSSNFSLSL